MLHLESTESPQLRLAKQWLEEIFQCGYPKAIKAAAGTLEVFARESRAWAEGQEERRSKLTVIRGGHSADRKQPGTSEVRI